MKPSSSVPFTSVRLFSVRIKLTSPRLFVCSILLGVRTVKPDPPTANARAPPGRANVQQQQQQQAAESQARMQAQADLQARMQAQADLQARMQAHQQARLQRQQEQRAQWEAAHQHAIQVREQVRLMEQEAERQQQQQQAQQEQLPKPVTVSLYGKSSFQYQPKPSSHWLNANEQSSAAAAAATPSTPPPGSSTTSSKLATKTTRPGFLSPTESFAARPASSSTTTLSSELDEMKAKHEAAAALSTLNPEASVDRTVESNDKTGPKDTNMAIEVYRDPSFVSGKKRKSHLTIDTNQDVQHAIGGQLCPYDDALVAANSNDNESPTPTAAPPTKLKKYSPSQIAAMQAEKINDGIELPNEGIDGIPNEDASVATLSGEMELTLSVDSKQSENGNRESFTRDNSIYFGNIEPVLGSDPWQESNNDDANLVMDFVDKHEKR